MGLRPTQRDEDILHQSRDSQGAFVRYAAWQTLPDGRGSDGSDLQRSGFFAMKYLLILLFGGAGSLARYLAGSAIMTRFAPRFPLGTMAINISGSFLIGLILTLLTERFQPHENWRMALVVGFLGGYTTFSSFEWETYQAMQTGGQWIGLLNVLGSVTLGYLAVWCGAALVRR